MEHLSTFGLVRDPFASEPRLSPFFASPAHRNAQQRIERGMRQARGLCVLTGPGGSGKTMLVRHLLESLEEEVFEVCMLVPVPGVSDGAWVLDRFARQLGVDAPASDAGARLGQIYEKLAIVREDGRHTVLIIDEAQLLGDLGALRDLRGLLNLEYEDRRLLTIVLVGPSELDDALAQEPALADRVEVRVKLHDLDPESAGRYVRHRIEAVGGSPLLFEPAALDVLVKRAGGNPRRLNVLADNSLFEAHLAGRTKASAADVERAADDLGGSLGESTTTDPATTGPLGPTFGRRSAAGEGERSGWKAGGGATPRPPERAPEVPAGAEEDLVCASEIEIDEEPLTAEPEPFGFDSTGKEPEAQPTAEGFEAGAAAPEPAPEELAHAPMDPGVAPSPPDAAQVAPADGAPDAAQAASAGFAPEMAGAAPAAASPAAAGAAPSSYASATAGAAPVGSAPATGGAAPSPLGPTDLGTVPAAPLGEPAGPAMPSRGAAAVPPPTVGTPLGLGDASSVVGVAKAGGESDSRSASVLQPEVSVPPDPPLMPRAPFPAMEPQKSTASGPLGPEHLGTAPARPAPAASSAPVGPSPLRSMEGAGSGANSPQARRATASGASAWTGPRTGVFGPPDPAPRGVSPEGPGEPASDIVSEAADSLDALGGEIEIEVGEVLAADTFPGQEAPPARPEAHGAPSAAPRAPAAAPVKPAPGAARAAAQGPAPARGRGEDDLDALFADLVDED